MTTFSPKSVRSVETRKSTSVPSSAVDRRRPSCGSRFSAMSIPRHDLQPRDQSFVNPLRKVHDLFEQSVEAMPDEHALFHRLDVDVARLALDRAFDDQID